MSTINIHAHTEFEGDIAGAYDSVVKNWLAQADSEVAKNMYRETVFPLRCEVVRRARGDVQELDLLFVPVGTQSFAPILAVVGNPSRCVALLESQLSAPYGKEVEHAFSGDGETKFIHVRIRETDVVDIGVKMRSVFNSRGLPDGARIGADITGGRKPMTAAVAGVGSIFRWRLFYVEGEYVREKQGYAINEKIVELSNVLDVFGEEKRQTALSLLAAGACAAAARVLRDLESESVASAADQALSLYAAACGSLIAGDVDRFSREAPKAAQAVGQKLSEKTTAFLAAARKGSSANRAGLLVAAAMARHTLNDELAAQALMDRAGVLLDNSVSKEGGSSIRIREARRSSILAPCTAEIAELRAVFITNRAAMAVR